MMPMKYTDEQKQDGGQLDRTEQHDAQESESLDACFTVDEAIEKVGFGWLQLRIYVICKLVVATDAIEIMLLALVGPVIQCEWGLKAGNIAFLSTMVFLGMVVSSPLLGMLGDNYGRRKALLYCTCVTAYFGFMTSFSPDYPWLVILRLLVGAGMGGIPHGYAIIAEYVPSKFRAKLLILGEAFWATGGLLEILLAALVTPTLGWRWLFAVSAIPVLVACLGCMAIPESARYLVAAGRQEEANAVLQRLASVNHAHLPSGTLVMAKKAESQWQSNEAKLARVADLFCPEYRRTTLLLWVTWFGASFSYYGVVLASPLLLQQESGDDPSCSLSCVRLTTADYLSLAFSTVGEFAGVILSLVLVDRLGRRWTGVVVFTLAAIFMVLLQLRAGTVLVTLLTFGARGCTLTLFNLAFVYTVEVYPTTIRALGLGLANSWGRLASMVTPFLAQMLMMYSVSITMYVYGAVCLTCAVCMFLLPIETKGRPMMQSVGSFIIDEPEKTHLVTSGDL